MNEKRTKNSKNVNKGMKNGFNPLSQNKPGEKSQSKEKNEIKIPSNKNSNTNEKKAKAKEIESKDNKSNQLSDCDVKEDKRETKNQIKEIIISYKYEPVTRNELFESIKIKLEKRNFSNDELIIDLNNLINECAIINKFNDITVLTPNFFEIFEEINVKKFLLTINLLNYLNIINGIWSYTKGKIDEFMSILKELGICLSYVKRDNKKNDEEIDIVLLTPKSPVIYNYISTYGELGFVNTDFKKIAKEYCEWDEKYNFDTGFCFEDLATLYLCDTLDKDNFIIFPNVTYFIKNEYAESLIKLNLIEIPKSYKVCSSKNKDFKGYNEIDFIIQIIRLSMAI